MAATPGEKLENGLFDVFALSKTGDFRRHYFAAVDFEELILVF